MQTQRRLPSRLCVCMCVVMMQGMEGGGKWGHRSLPPQGRGGHPPFQGTQRPMLLLHKAANAYHITLERDEMEKKQRAFNAILNKLTPDNFEKLLDQIYVVGCKELETLIGLIQQLFEKALKEPTFCKLYAELCAHLCERMANDKIEFKDESEQSTGKSITFKRALLNQCQTEFEKVTKAVGADGCTAAVAAATACPLARRRMLGNIRFIGELFKQSLLTENIIHGCILQLLGDQELPVEDNVEALCKLLSTIGQQMEHMKQVKIYFLRMESLAMNSNISSRHRFLVQEVLELRENDWTERRQQEGPRKIEDVGTDAPRNTLERGRQMTGVHGGRGGGSGGGGGGGSRRGAHLPLSCERDPQGVYRGGGGGGGGGPHSRRIGGHMRGGRGGNSSGEVSPLACSLSL
jgi:translation initiation factor 4G